MSRRASTPGFWADLKRPIMALAPMDDVTDAAFRKLVAYCGKPDISFTEFVSVDGLCSEQGRERLARDLYFDEVERPVVAQLFGDKPENFEKAARMVAELGFDGIDINMGCPIKAVCKTGSGASLIETPDKAQDIVRATIEGAGRLPVSVKSRIGYNKLNIEAWPSALLETKPAAITFHLRTKKEMSGVPAHWELMPDIVRLARGSGVLILGNGDVRTLEQGEKLCAETGCDGVMFGRALFGNPWLFDREKRLEDIPLEKKLDTMMYHARLYEKVFGSTKKFHVIRKHMMAYANGFRGAKDFRMTLEDVLCADDVINAVAAFRARTDV